MDPKNLVILLERKDGFASPFEDDLEQIRSLVNKELRTAFREDRAPVLIFEGFTTHVFYQPNPGQALVHIVEEVIDDPPA